MNSQITAFLEDNLLCHDSQSGFHAGNSTKYVLLEVSEAIRENLDPKSPVMLMLLDLSTAFDTVSHSILLERLDRIGIREQSLAWLKSFISNCSQTLSLPPFTSGVRSHWIVGCLRALH